MGCKRIPHSALTIPQLHGFFETKSCFFASAKQGRRQLNRSNLDEKSRD
jgi:hypothetical protein